MEKVKKKRGRDPRELNNFSLLSKEERVEIARRGGQASARKRKDKKRLKDCLETLLETTMVSDTGERVTGAEALAVRIFNDALEGNTKAWELVRDTAGQKPAEKQETVNTDIVVDLSVRRDDD